MADEGLLNVEDDTPEPAAPPAAAPVAAAPAEPPVEPPPDPDEQEAVEIQGGKYVPLPAQLAQLQGQVAGYREVQENLRRQAPAPPQAPQTDERALAFARGLDLYTTDASGQAVPDTAKAASILGIVKELAKQESQQASLPVAQHMARQASIQNYQWALSVKDPHGKTLDRNIVNEVWKSMPIEATANPEIAKTLVYTAMGMERMNQQAQPPAPGPVVHTESVGGNPRTRPQLSALETKVAAERGIDHAKWAENTKDFVKGRTVTLED